jgi:capsular exopolysaccharide synthesis family protein
MSDKASLIPRSEIFRPPARMELSYEPEKRPPGEVDLRDVWNKLRRHRKLILLCAVLGIAGAIYVTRASLPMYQAEASVRVQSKESFLGGTRGLTTVPDAAEELSTEREILHSRALAEDVADSLNLALTVVEPRNQSASVILANAKVTPGTPLASYELTRTGGDSFLIVSTLGGASPATVPFKIEAHVGEQVDLNGVSFTLRPEAALYPRLRFSVVAPSTAAERVRAATTILQPVRDASIIVIRYKGPDAYLARAIPNTLARRFVSRRQSTQKTESRSAVRFLREQLDSLGPQLTLAEDSLRVFREREKIVSLTSEGSVQVARLAALQARYADVQAERSGLAQLLTEVQAEDSRRSPDSPSPYRRLLAYPTLLGNGGSSQMLSSLTSTDDQRTALLLRRTPKDPDVQVLTSHIHDIEGQIKALALTYIHGLELEAGQLNSEISRFGKEMQAVPAKEVTYARLERKPKLLDGIYTLLQSRLKEAQIDEGIEDASVQMLDSALVPDSPVSPKPALNLGVGLTLGIVLGILIAFFREQMDNSVHTREQLRKVTRVPVLGLIPRIQTNFGVVGRATSITGSLENIPRRLQAFMRSGLSRDSSSLQRARLLQVSESLVSDSASEPTFGHDLRSPVSEAYRGLRTNITFSHADDPPRVLVFTSPMPQDGKTTSAANLAVTLVQQGLKVLLVDGDMRRGQLHTLFDVPQKPGLSGVLLGTSAWKEAVAEVEVSGSGALHVMTTGGAAMNPAELLGSAAMGEFIASAKESYDIVLFDSPPLNLVTDAAVLGIVANGVVLVARAGKTTDDAMRFAMEQLRQVGAPVLGTILNDIDFDRDVRYYGGYGSYAYAYQSSR